MKLRGPPPPTYPVFTAEDPTTAFFLLMYTQVGDFCIRSVSPTVPLTRILSNGIFLSPKICVRQGDPLLLKNNWWKLILFNIYVLVFQAYPLATFDRLMIPPYLLLSPLLLSFREGPKTYSCPKFHLASKLLLPFWTLQSE